MSKSSSLSLPIQRQYRKEVVRALLKEDALPRDHYVCQLCGWLVEQRKVSGFCHAMMVHSLTHIGPDRVCWDCVGTAKRVQQTCEHARIKEWLVYLLSGRTRHCVICQKEVSKEDAHLMGNGRLCQNCCKVWVVFVCQHEE